MSFSKAVKNSYYSLFDLKKLDENGHHPDGPVVSLTTVPSRIDKIKPTLISLLRQKVKPKRIEINLSRELFKDIEIPSALNNLKTIKFHWQDKDYGPATKLISTIKRHESSLERIIIVDDDMYYSEHLIQDLLSADLNSNGSQAFCINGFLLAENLQSESMGSDNPLKSGSRKVAVLEGCGGYILRTSFLDYASLLDLERAPVRAWFDDDVWISGHLSRRGIEKIQIATGKRKSLANTINSAITGNRSQLRTEVAKYFKDDWKKDEFEKTNFKGRY